MLSFFVQGLRLQRRQFFFVFSTVNFYLKFCKNKSIMPPKRKAVAKVGPTIASMPAVPQEVGDGPSPPKVKKSQKEEPIKEIPVKEEKSKRATKKELLEKKTKVETADNDVKERPKRGTKKEGEKSTEAKEEKSEAEAKKKTKEEKPKRGTKKEPLGAEERPKRGIKTETQPEEASSEGANITKRGERSKLKSVDGEPNKKGAKSKKEEDVKDELKSAKKKMPAKDKEAREKSEEKPVTKLKKVDSKKEDAASKSKSTKKTNGDAKEPAAKLLNDTASNWDSINFSSDRKNAKGETFNLKITSWNVAGCRAWIKKDGMNIFKYDSPDILCLQELQCSEDKLPQELKEVEGYKGYRVASEQEGYAGVAVYSKIMPIDVQYGIKDPDFDNEGRCITLEYEKFYLVNVYVPNAGRGLKTLDKRMDWNEVFRKYIKSLDMKKPVILCGDMNVAHEEIDLANPKNNKKNAGFTPEEREGMTEFLKDGYIDTFREIYPEKTGAYTFWSYMSKARAKNVGWRLDYFIVSSQIINNICDTAIRDEVMGSDHCPLSLFLHI